MVYYDICSADHIDPGYLVLGVDYFLGDPVQNHDGEQGFDRPAWFAKARVNAADVLPGWVEGVKQKYGMCLCKTYLIQSSYRRVGKGVHGISYSAVGKLVYTKRKMTEFNRYCVIQAIALVHPTYSSSSAVTCSQPVSR